MNTAFQEPTIGSLRLETKGLNTTITDMEWRLFKHYAKYCPNEPFHAVAYDSILKRATREGIPTTQLFHLN